METVIIVIHLMVIAALIAVVLMQRSEGGALGIGGANNFLSTRGQGNVLTRSTAILAAAFFATSLSLTVLARLTEKPSAILDSVPAAGAPAIPGGTTGTGTGQGILDQLQKMSKTPAGTTPPAAGGTTTPPADGTPPLSTTPPASTAPGTPQVPTTQ